MNKFISLRLTRRRVFVASVAVAACLGVGVGAAYGASLAGPAGVSTEPGGPVAPRLDPAYPTNDAGLTYGSVATANDPADEPELILATATNGRKGYVKKADLADVTGENVANPGEAVAFQERMDKAAANGEVFYIPVYDVNGKAVVGQFVVSPSSSSSSSTD